MTKILASFVECMFFKISKKNPGPEVAFSLVELVSKMPPGVQKHADH